MTTDNCRYTRLILFGGYAETFSRWNPQRNSMNDKFRLLSFLLAGNWRSNPGANRRHPLLLIPTPVHFGIERHLFAI